MYEPHAAREDTILFPAFKKAVGPKGYNELGDQFEDIERRTFGGDGFDIAIDKIADIERRLGLADLNAFTAPALTYRGDITLALSTHPARRTAGQNRDCWSRNARLGSMGSLTIGKSV